MEYIVEGDSLKKVEIVGDIVVVLEQVEAAKLRLSHAKAKLAHFVTQVQREEEALTVLESQLTKLEMPERELSEEEKVKLVISGIKSHEDFPGDDWLTEYASKGNLPDKV